jgi:hypothetical protein
MLHAAPFMQQLTDAILVKDKGDVGEIRAALAQEGLSLADKEKQWHDSRTKRTAPAGNIIKANVSQVIETLRDKVCPLTGNHVITEAVLAAFHQQCVADIELGGKLYNTWDLTEGERYPLDGVVECCHSLG